MKEEIEDIQVQVDRSYISLGGFEYAFFIIILIMVLGKFESFVEIF
jgi:hypothetical protein